MGCGHGKTIEKKIKNKKYSIPKCSISINCNCEITSMALIDKNSILLGTQNEIKLLEISSNEPKTLFTEHKGSINYILKLKNGLFASAGQDKKIKIWDLKEKKSKITLEGHKSMIWTITESLDEKLISGADDKKIIVWDLKNEKIDFVLFECKNEISSLITLKDGKIMSGSGDNFLRIWNLNKKEIINEIKCDYSAWCLRELHNNKIAVGLGNGDILIYNIKN